MQSDDEWVLDLFEYLPLSLCILLLIHLHDLVLAQHFHREDLAGVHLSYSVDLGEGATSDHHHLIEVFGLLRLHGRLVGLIAE